MTDSRRFTDARRQLRAKRVLDAVGISSSTSELSLRDNLLPELAIAVELPDQLRVNDDLIDAAVSVGTARGPETDFDHLVALLTASELLAHSGDFVRLRGFTTHLWDLSARIKHDRPYLAVAIGAFSLIVQGRRSAALRDLKFVLGIESETAVPLAPIERESRDVGDVYLVNALRFWLQENDLSRLEQARKYAIELVDGLLLATSSLLNVFAVSASKASTISVISSLEAAFTSENLTNYLNLRGIDTLFPAQVSAVESGVLREDSCLVAMPTSSGKTFLAELRIVAELARRGSGRAIYLAPYRLLSGQVAEELQRGLRPLSLRVQDFGGTFDASVDEIDQTGLPDVAVMTPERLDALVRLSGSGRRGDEAATELLASCVLLVIDELQLVGRSGRGPKLELIVARLRQRLPNVPIVGIAAVPLDVSQLAAWLEAREIAPSFARPTGLIELIWRPDGSLSQRFNGGIYRVGQLDRPAGGTAIASAAALVGMIQKERLPVLFVETQRAYAESVVEKAAEISPRDGDRWRVALSETNRKALDDTAALADTVLGPGSNLGSLIRQGLAFHHAGLPSHLLREIESLTRAGALRAIGATTTVAEGAELPFRTVVIPHLNFGARGSLLDRDLYNNIIGRAGRANAAIEGLVIVIGSDAPSMRNYVERTLWREDDIPRLSGRLLEVTDSPSGIEAYRHHREIKSQILGWLGDDGSYVDYQAEFFASATFTWQSTTDRARVQLIQQLTSIFTELEDQGLAEAASPFKLTLLGEKSRLAGLGPASCRRLAARVESAKGSLALEELAGANRLSRQGCDAIASIVLNSEEVVERTLWFRRNHRTDHDALALLSSLMKGDTDWPYSDPLYAVDLDLLSRWINGAPYTTLAKIAPIFGGRGLFGSNNAGDRASDAAEYLGRIAYPASWTWGAVVALLGDDGDQIPSWIRKAIEIGVPSEAAVGLISRCGLSRVGAMALDSFVPGEWDQAELMLTELTVRDFQRLGITDSDVHSLALYFNY